MQLDQREQELARVPFQPVDRSTWPPHVRGIGIDELDAFGIDAERQLYWHGKPIEVRKSVQLTFWQKLAAAAVSISTVVLAVTEVAKSFMGL